MWHRLRVGTAAGEELGYQWRNIDYALFAVILAGQRPVADQEAQTRDDPAITGTGQSRTMHYLAVWDFDCNDWCTGHADPETVYESWAQSEAGA